MDVERMRWAARKVMREMALLNLLVGLDLQSGAAGLKYRRSRMRFMMR
jgi:hypothetical protein